jgi:hypothetical protein
MKLMGVLAWMVLAGCSQPLADPVQLEVRLHELDARIDDRVLTAEGVAVNGVVGWGATSVVMVNGGFDDDQVLVSIDIPDGVQTDPYGLVMNDCWSDPCDGQVIVFIRTCGPDECDWFEVGSDDMTVLLTDDVERRTAVVDTEFERGSLHARFDYRAQARE